MEVAGLHKSPHKQFEPKILFFCALQDIIPVKVLIFTIPGYCGRMKFRKRLSNHVLVSDRIDTREANALSSASTRTPPLFILL